MHSQLQRHACFALVIFFVSSNGYSQEDDAVITEGRTVGFEYTLTLTDGTLVESNVNEAPFTYLHGDQQILPALEAALAGMAVEETKSVSLEAEDAYGPVDPEAFQEVPIQDIPEDARAVGTQLGMQGYGGPIRVHEVREETIVLDFNNPLAGKALNFDIRIISIE